MGVRILVGTYDGTQDDAAVMVDSTSGEAFGPVFDSYDDCEAFSDWFATAQQEDTARELGFDVRRDPRGYSAWHLRKLHAAWKAQREPVEEPAF
jgi:hypothetical protein